MISCHDARIMDFDHGSMKSYGGYDGTQIHDFIGKSMMSYYVQICDAPFALCLHGPSGLAEKDPNEALHGGQLELT